MFEPEFDSMSFQFGLERKFHLRLNRATLHKITTLGDIAANLAETAYRQPAFLS